MATEIESNPKRKTRRNPGGTIEQMAVLLVGAAAAIYVWNNRGTILHK